MATRLERMLDSLPFYYEGEPVLHLLVALTAQEIDRLEERLDAIRDGLLPGMATDFLGLLGIWETILGLPVEPAGATEGQRQTKVRAAVQRLASASGADWVVVLTEAIGANWTYQENTPGDGQLLIEIPYDPGSWQTGQVEEIARATVPAHLAIVMHYSSGFLLDVSLLDQDTL